MGLASTKSVRASGKPVSVRGWGEPGPEPDELPGGMSRGSVDIGGRLRAGE
jgi:hypothetical protein